MDHRHLLLALFFLLIVAMVISGCASSETLSSEVQSGAKSRDKASAIQNETNQRLKEGEAVLSGK